MLRPRALALLATLLGPMLATPAAARVDGVRVGRAADVEVCAPATAWRPADHSTPVPAVVEQRPAPEVPGRESGAPEPAARRPSHFCTGFRGGEGREAARVQAFLLACLDALPRLAAARRGVHFGGTAPPPLLS